MQYEGQEGRAGRLAEIRREVNKMGGPTLGKARSTTGWSACQMRQTSP